MTWSIRASWTATANRDDSLTLLDAFFVETNLAHHPGNGEERRERSTMTHDPKEGKIFLLSDTDHINLKIVKEYDSSIQQSFSYRIQSVEVSSSQS